MLPLLTPVVVPVGTAIMSALSYIFRFAVVQFLVSAAFVSALTLVGYAIADRLLPPWLTVDNLHSAVTGFHPAVAYFLDLLGFYKALPLLTTALGAAWVFKKVPVWAWLGPLLRTVK